ncbi:hypothetical protein L2E82_29433 [Cichorium intybus]|uniref:Uncharacterized protein n=1 Tax=Cichorium intybus TaxID=13427 RepID=A0ACB9CXL0_CICIN|nr:hypothetical protein L2E82_29433 [Cichorium intybus]
MERDEEEDEWDEDISDTNSVKSIPAEENWGSGDGREGKQEELPQPVGSTCMDVPITKVWPSPVIEKTNYDIGDPPSLSGGSNGLHEKEIYNGTRADDVARNKRQVERKGEHVELGHRKGFGLDLGMDQENKFEAQRMEKNADNPKCGLKKMETQLADNSNEDELEPFEDQWLEMNTIVTIRERRRCMGEGNSEWNWNWAYDPRGRTRNELEGLIELLNAVQFSGNMELRDSWKWMLSKKCEFKVKALRMLVETKLQDQSAWLVVFGLGMYGRFYPCFACSSQALGPTVVCA